MLQQVIWIQLSTACRREGQTGAENLRLVQECGAGRVSLALFTRKEAYLLSPDVGAELPVLSVLGVLLGAGLLGALLSLALSDFGMEFDAGAEFLWA